MPNSAKLRNAQGIFSEESRYVRRDLIFDTPVQSFFQILYLSCYQPKNLVVKTSKILLTGICLFVAVSVTRAQSPKHFRDSLIADAVKQLIDSRQFIFFVQSVMAPGGQNVPMAGENYTFRIHTDSVQLNLPYVGRSYQAVTDYKTVGFQFKAGDIGYEVKERKRGGWNVTIPLHHSTRVSRIMLNVLKDGSATLHVTPRNKQPISYQGNIAGRE